MARARVIKQPPLLAAPEHTIADVMALKALYDGRATPEQQQRAIIWIMKKACMIGGISYTPGDSSATDQKEGRRYVGIWINEFINEPVEEVRKRLKPTHEED